MFFLLYQSFPRRPYYRPYSMFRPAVMRPTKWGVFFAWLSLIWSVLSYFIRLLFFCQVQWSFLISWGVRGFLQTTQTSTQSPSILATIPQGSSTQQWRGERVQQRFGKPTRATWHHHEGHIIILMFKMAFVDCSPGGRGFQTQSFQEKTESVCSRIWQRLRGKPSSPRQTHPA